MTNMPSPKGEGAFFTKTNKVLGCEKHPYNAGTETCHYANTLVNSKLHNTYQKFLLTIFVCGAKIYAS